MLPFNQINIKDIITEIDMNDSQHLSNVLQSISYGVNQDLKMLENILDKVVDNATGIEVSNEEIKQIVENKIVQLQTVRH